MTLLRYALRVLGGLIGVVLIVYPIALVLLGMEDAGGPGVTVPTALVLTALGVFAIFLAPRRRKADF